MPYIINEGWNTLPEQVEENKKNIKTLADVIAITKKTPKGAWQASTVYEAGDIVTYNHKTYEYISSEKTAGTSPLNTTYWKVIIDPEGGGVNWMGIWVSGSDHYENDIVKYNKNTYICIQNIDPSVVDPETDTTHWMLFVPAGVSVSSIIKTGTSGLTDTYTITYSDATTSTFTINNGKSITSVAKTSTAGLVDTYTISYNDGTTSTFDITNGQDGSTTVYDDNGNAISSVNSATNGGIAINSSGKISTTMTQKHLYFHPITIIKTSGTNVYAISFSLLNNSSVRYNKEDLNTYLINNGIRLVSTGGLYSSTSSISMIVSTLKYENNTYNITGLTTSGSYRYLDVGSDIISNCDVFIDDFNQLF